MAFITTNWSPNEIPTSAKMQQMSDNDEALRDGTGLGDESVTNAKLAGDITVDKLINPYKFRVTRVSNQASIANITATTVQFNNETYDPNNNFNTSTYKYTVPVSGVYEFNALVRIDGTDITVANAIIKGDAGQLSKDYIATAAVSSVTARIHDQLDLVAGDEIYIQVYVGLASGTATIIGTASELWFSGHLLSVTV